MPRTIGTNSTAKSTTEVAIASSGRCSTVIHLAPKAWKIISSNRDAIEMPPQ